MNKYTHSLHCILLLKSIGRGVNSIAFTIIIAIALICDIYPVFYSILIRNLIYRVLELLEMEFRFLVFYEVKSPLKRRK